MAAETLQVRLPCVVRCIASRGLEVGDSSTVTVNHNGYGPPWRPSMGGSGDAERNDEPRRTRGSRRSRGVRKQPWGRYAAEIRGRRRGCGSVPPSTPPWRPPSPTTAHARRAGTSPGPTSPTTTATTTANNIFYFLLPPPPVTLGGVDLDKCPSYPCHFVYVQRRGAGQRRGSLPFDLNETPSC
jgi:hypothetical protein